MSKSAAAVDYDGNGPERDIGFKLRGLVAKPSRLRVRTASRRSKRHGARTPRELAGGTPALRQNENCCKLRASANCTQIRRARAYLELSSLPRLAFDSNGTINKEKPRTDSERSSLPPDRIGKRATARFLGELIPGQPETEESRRMSELFQRQLNQCLEKDERGQFKLTVTLPDPTAVANLANSLARLVASAPRV